MTDLEREERAIWKLEQAGDLVERGSNGGYLVISDNHVDELNDLTALVAHAEAVYERVWTGRRVTPSA
jgi:hypothetical protein